MNTRKKIIVASAIIVGLAVVIGFIAYGINNGGFSFLAAGTGTSLPIIPSSIISTTSSNPLTLSPKPSSSFAPAPQTPLLSAPLPRPSFNYTPVPQTPLPSAPVSTPTSTSVPTPTKTLTFSPVPTATPTPPVSIDTISPVVRISSPTDGAKNISRFWFFFTRHYLTVNASASDNVKVVRMELYIDGTIMSNVPQSSISYNWDVRVASKGSHVIQVKAYDAAGNVGSKMITVYK